MEMYVYVCSSATILHKSSITIKNPKTIKYYTKKNSPIDMKKDLICVVSHSQTHQTESTSHQTQQRKPEIERKIYE